MSKYKYKNVTDNEMWLPGIGRVQGGQEFVSSHNIENPNIELVEEVQEAAPAETVVATQAPQPNMVTDLTPVTGEQNNG